MSGAQQAALSLFSLAGQGGEKIRWEKLLGQDKGSLKNQRLHAEAKKKQRFVLYFPPADVVQPLPRK